jgi:hypothetical protein
MDAGAGVLGSGYSDRSDRSSKKWQQPAPYAANSSAYCSQPTATKV